MTVRPGFGVGMKILNGQALAGFITAGLLPPLRFKVLRFVWSRSYPGTPRYVISRRFERTPSSCALIWEMGVGAPLAPYPMAPCSRAPLRSRPDVEIPGVRRGGGWWWCCRHKGVWAPMGAGAGVGRAGVVRGAVLIVHYL